MLITLLQKNFYAAQLLIGGIFLLVLWLFFRPRDPDSGFRVREADLKKPGAPKKAADGGALANAKLKRNEPLSLPGIRIDGAPHEILGVSAQASSAEVNQAFRDLMKRYHPDLVGRPGSREWQDAQKIANAVIQAKDRMLKKS